MKALKKFGLCMCMVAVALTGCSNQIADGSTEDMKKIESTSTVKTGVQSEYVEKLFDESYVHTINIEIADEDWRDLLENPLEETYYSCDITIDGETISNVGFRTKGNSSLSQVASSDSDRYSFMVKFDKFDKEQNYYGLDKLALNNIIQDATFMKDYLAYTMMAQMDVASPEVSYTYLTINGEEAGLYLNVETIDNAFLERNYGEEHGELYKPSTDGDVAAGPRAEGMKMPEGMTPPEGMEMPEGMAPPEGIEMPEGMTPPEGMEMPENMAIPEQGNMPNKGGVMGSKEPLGADLKYVDNQYESYANIFDNAKTKIDDEDKDRLIASLQQLSTGENLEQVINIEATLRYFVVHNFLDNYDSYTGNMLHNYYLYEDNGQLSMLPWDYNLSFGAFNMRMGSAETSEIQGIDEATQMVNMPIDTPLSGTTEGERPMWSQLINNKTYKTMYHSLFDEFLTTYLESGVIEQEIDRVTEMITPYVQQDPTGFYTYEEFEKGITTLKSFINLRMQSIRGQLSGDIPSTSAGQNEAKESLIDASSLSLTDMGSAGAGKGDNRNERPTQKMK